MNEVFVLLADGDDTWSSVATPFGVAVSTEEEAKRFVREGRVGTKQGYETVTIFDNMEEAIAYRYPPHPIQPSKPDSPPRATHLYDHTPNMRFVQVAKEDTEIKV